VVVEDAVDGVAMEGVGLILSNDELSRKVQEEYLDCSSKSALSP
jgi:hypothetical protein